MEDRCLFETRGSSSCDASEAGIKTQLSKCTDDIKGHLETCHLSQLIGSVQEYELILNRAGMHDVPAYQLGRLWICNKHRSNMGNKWRPLQTCQYPVHTGPRKKLRTRNAVNNSMSKEIRLLFAKDVPTGSQLCISCFKLHKNMLEENRAWMEQGTEEDEPLSRSSSSSEEESEACGSAILVFNAALDKLGKKTSGLLPFELQTTWNNATQEDKDVCIEKATEACSLVCSVIAPKAGPELFRSCFKPETEYGEIVQLMQAYQSATTKNVKTQILSLYAYRYPVKTLQKIHEPFAKLTEWQIKRARAHARDCGPGSAVEKLPSHRVRLPPAKLDHFIYFINRPYFYQDVAFGTRRLKLDSGERITMPNVIRKVTRSTMIKQYLQFCEEERVEPLSCGTLFRILEVREASQQRSLSGLDNTAAEGSAGFEHLSKIVDELESVGLEKGLADDLRKSLGDGKKYFKTEYQSHCQDVESQCADHCRKFGLSDPDDPDLQEHCTHQHTVQCSQCDDITSCFYKIQQIVRDGKSLKFYSKEQQDDLLYDINKATESILQWKAHIMRSVNQECAKQDILLQLTDNSSCFIVMDWAMKFLQLRYREKQSDWFGKRGLSWHISSVISRGQSETIEVTSYAHLFNQCTQDWYAVTSVIEDLLKQLKASNPLLQKVYLRSDEAGCYHNSSLIAAARDVARRVGVQVDSYHFSEPQSGKDICDRILCPMKSSIRTYCNEGHDVLTAVDMRKALKQHPVKGTTAAVNVVNETKKNLTVNKIEHFSSFHNFEYGDSGLRVWKCYGIGSGKYFPYKHIYVKHQGPTMLETTEAQDFYDPTNKSVQNQAETQSVKPHCSNAPCLDASRRSVRLRCWNFI